MERDTRKAPSGQFRVIGQDAPGDRGWKQGDYSTFVEAARHAIPCGCTTIRFRVFDDKGKPVDAV